MTRLRSVLALAFWLAVFAAIAALTRVPYDAEGSGRALLRLSWRVFGERIERCRPATAAELAAAPAHMRQAVICEGARVAPYALRVAVDGRVLADAPVPGSGVPGDRPIYVLREFELAPGPHHIQVLFRRTDPDSSVAPLSVLDPRAGREAEARRRAVPPHLGIDTTVTVPAGRVLLVTYGAEARALLVADGQAR